jgi:hypothetical protein
MDTSEILRPFVKDMRHLTSQLNNIASDMIRDKALAKKLDDDPDYFRKTYSISEEELAAMRERNLPKLFELGLHPFLLVRHVGPVSAASRASSSTPFCTSSRMSSSVRFNACRRLM